MGLSRTQFGGLLSGIKSFVSGSGDPTDADPEGQRTNAQHHEIVEMGQAATWEDLQRSKLDSFHDIRVSGDYMTKTGRDRREAAQRMEDLHNKSYGMYGANDSQQRNRDSAVASANSSYVSMADPDTGDAATHLPY